MTTPREIIAEAYSDMELNAISADDAVSAIISRLTTAGIHLKTDAELAARDDGVLALERSIVAIDDWLHTYAPDECMREHVRDTRLRIYDGGGTLAYIAEIQSRNRAAIRSLKGGRS